MTEKGITVTHDSGRRCSLKRRLKDELQPLKNFTGGVYQLSPTLWTRAYVQGFAPPYSWSIRFQPPEFRLSNPWSVSEIVTMHGPAQPPSAIIPSPEKSRRRCQMVGMEGSPPGERYVPGAMSTPTSNTPSPNVSRSARGDGASAFDGEFPKLIPLEELALYFLALLR